MDAISQPDEDDDNSWILELESALLADCELSLLKKITNHKSVPDQMRFEFWQACLGVKGRSKLLEDVFDLPEQPAIRDDCQSLVASLGNDECDRVAIRSDVESIVTNYSKLTGQKYSTGNGWLEMIEPLLALRVKRDELFKLFEAIVQRFVPKCFDDQGLNVDPQPFHLLRLLLQYHDPELCSFLDTKRITPDRYADTWFRSLFSRHCQIKVITALWDVYFSLADPFLVFFLAIVMLVNEKDEITNMKDADQQAIIDKLRSVPSGLCLDDIGDLFYLVEQHYVSRTPNIKMLSPILFQSAPPPDSSSTPSPDLIPDDLSQLLCLPVAVDDLLPSVGAGSSATNTIKYLVFDCRPADQYNNGHLSTAFHLDCSLMLQEPSAFNTAVEALFAAQKSVAEAKSTSGGQHLCFMGSGREEEDQYVHMVVASFLQKNYPFVSLALGGFAAFHQLVMSNPGELDKYLVDHNKKKCLACNVKPTGKKGSQSRASERSSFANSFKDSGDSSQSDVEHFTSALLDKVANAVKSKTSEMKGKLVEYMTNPNQQQLAKMERHVSARDKVGKRYKGSGSGSRYAIDDPDDNCQEWDDEHGQEIDVDEWSKSTEVIGCFKCQEIKDDGHTCPSYLGLTQTHLFVMREIPHNKGYVKIMAKRPLEMIVQITSKRRCPDLITFKYGHTSDTNDGGPNIVAADHLLISKPYDVTRLIKQQVIRILDGDVSSGSNASAGSK